MVDAKYRHQILVGVLGRRQEMENEIRAGTRMRYRGAEEIQGLKIEDKQGHINTWFLRGEVTSILQVQATPNGELAKLVQRRVSGMRTPDGGTVKVVEKAGEAVLAGMLAPDPHMEKGCP